jgi:hypothetical protein
MTDEAAKKSKKKKKVLSDETRAKLRNQWPPSHDYGTRDNDELFYKFETDGESHKVVGQTAICKNFKPLFVAADADGGRESIILAVAGMREPFVLPFASLAGTSGRAVQEISERGLTIFPGPEAHNAFLYLIAHARSMDLPSIVMTDAPGFALPDDKGVPTVFVQPDGRNVGRGGSTETKLMLRNAKQNQILGTEAGSRDAMRACWESGLAHFMVAPLGGVVGTLRTFAETADSASVGLIGPSSGGKTTALKVIASAWGDPRNKRGPLRSLRQTDNAMESVLQANNHTVACLDETRLFAGDLESLLFMVSDGAGKDRATASMSAKRTALWNLVAFFSSETPIEELVKQAAKGRKTRVGLSVRVPSLMIEKRKLAPEIMAPINACRQHFGHIGPAFARYLLDHETPERVAERIDAKVREIADDSDLLQSRVAPIFAALWDAGDLLKRPELGVLPPEADVESFVKSLWQAYLAGEAARLLRPEKAALDSLRNTFFERMAKHGHNVNEKEYAPPGELEFWFDRDDDAGTVDFYITAKSLNAPAGGRQYTRDYVPVLKLHVSVYRFRYKLVEADAADAKAEQVALARAEVASLTANDDEEAHARAQAQRRDAAKREREAAATSAAAPAAVIPFADRSRKHRRIF